MNKHYFRFSLITLTIVTFLILIISIGYSAFSNNNSIEGISATVRIDKDIRVTGVRIIGSSSDASVTYSEYNVNSILTGINLPTADSFIILGVDITNLGNVEMGVKSISGLDGNLEYELLNYHLKDKICDNNSKCINGITKTIEFKIKNNSADSVLQNTKLDFEFKPFHNITYSSLVLDNVNEENLITEVIDGDDLAINILTDSIDNFSIKSNNELLLKNIDYTYQNNILTISNISNDIYVDMVYVPLEENFSGLGVNGTVTWLSNNEFEVTLNGTTTADIYVRIVKNDIYIGASAASLYKDIYANNPIYKKGDNVFIKYDYIEGNYSFKGAFTVKYRDTKKSCQALNASELIANNAKENFEMNSSFKNSAVLNDNVSSISIFSSKGNTFDNLKFKVSYGLDQ